MDWSVIVDSRSTWMHEVEIAARFALASLFGAAIGFERELKDRPAGLKTHMLISLAAAVFTILTFEIYAAIRAIEGDPNVDPLRVIEAVTAGVAFLAAGTIIQGRGNVKGLTTGAGMWMAGAIGVACGAGYYLLALIATVLSVLILVVVNRFESYILGTKGVARQQAAAEPD